jgi:hypothetical protein
MIEMPQFPTAMTQISLVDAQQNLPAIISGLQPGEAGQIGDRPSHPRIAENPPRIPGSAIGTLTIVTDDDAHLEGFGDYMP